jgi:hypothetical protein
MVRDQVDDFLDRIDPLRMIRDRLLASELARDLRNRAFGSSEARNALWSD